MMSESIKKELIAFLLELPVEKFTREWEALQIAISMLNSPKSFKKGIHVYLTSSYRAHEEGYYDHREMTIKIYPHKVMMRRTHSEYNTYSDINRNEVYRYITPSDKYGDYAFHQVMADLRELFTPRYSIDNSDASGVCYVGGNFTIEANMK